MSPLLQIDKVSILIFLHMDDMQKNVFSFYIFTFILSENAIEIVLLDVTLQSGHTKQISIMCMVSKTVGHRNWQTISDYVLCVIVIIEEHW